MAPIEAASPLAHEVTGSGRRVVFIHGFTQSKGSWRSIAGRLAERAQVVVLDLPDHGGSSAVHARDLSEAARLVGATGGRATYVGYSLGGRVALTLGLEAPELVEALVLIGAHPGIADDAERARRREADDALARRLDPPGEAPGLELEAFLSEWLAGPLFAHLSAEQADLGSRLVNSAVGLAASLRSCGTGTQEPSGGRLGELAMPVLVLAGERDERFSALGQEMAAAIGPNASVASVPGAGHAAPFEQPEAFTEILRTFLDRT